MELRIEDLDQQKNNLHAKISELEKSGNLKKEKLEKISRNYDEQLKVYQNKIKKLKHQLELEKNSESEKVSELKILLQKNNSIIIKFKNEIDKLKKELDQTRFEKINLQSEIKLLEHNLEFEKKTSHQTISQHKQKQIELELTIALKEDEVKLKQAKIDELQQSLIRQEEIFGTEIQSIKKELTSLYNKINDYENRLSLEWILRLLDRLLLR